MVADVALSETPSKAQHFLYMSLSWEGKS
jgi:hypothetical protein